MSLFPNHKQVPKLINAEKLHPWKSQLFYPLSQVLNLPNPSNISNTRYSIWHTTTQILLFSSQPSSEYITLTIFKPWQKKRWSLASLHMMQMSVLKGNSPTITDCRSFLWTWGFIHSFPLVSATCTISHELNQTKKNSCNGSTFQSSQLYLLTTKEVNIMRYYES